MATAALDRRPLTPNDVSDSVLHVSGLVEAPDLFPDQLDRRHADPSPIEEIAARNWRTVPQAAPERLASPFLHGFTAMPVRIEGRSRLSNSESFHFPNRKTTAIAFHIGK